MRVVSQVLIVCSVSLTAIGLIPCFGWLNWYAVPVSITCAIAGAVGMATDRGEAGLPPATGIHTTAALAGSVATLVGIVRCMLGCGGV